MVILRSVAWKVLFCRNYRPAGGAVKAGLRGAINRAAAQIAPKTASRPGLRSTASDNRARWARGGRDPGRTGALPRLPKIRPDGWLRDRPRRQQPLLHHLVVAAEHRLERRDHVADDIFRRVVQQRCNPEAGVDARHLLAH